MLILKYLYDLLRDFSAYLDVRFLKRRVRWMEKWRWDLLRNWRFSALITCLKRSSWIFIWDTWVKCFLVFGKSQQKTHLYQKLYLCFLNSCINLRSISQIYHVVHKILLPNCEILRRKCRLIFEIICLNLSCLEQKANVKEYSLLQWDGY